MGLLSIKRPWDSQPQEAVPVDQRWLDAGLAAAITRIGGGNGPVRDLLWDAGVPDVDTSTPAAMAQGFVADVSGSQYLRLPDRPEYRATGAVTIICGVVVRSYSGYGHLLSKNGTTAGDNTPFEFRHDSPTGNELCVVRASSSTYSIFTSSGATSSTGYRVNAVRFVDGALNGVPSMWQNGKALTVNTAVSNTGSVGDNGQPIYIGKRQDSVTQLDGQILFIWIFTKALSDGQIDELSRNPWALLKPREFPLALSPSSAFTYAGSGGLTFAGAATTAYTANFSATGAGGLTFGGAATTTYTAAYSATGSGGLQFGGAATATFDTGYAYTGTGGLQFGGSAATTYTVAFAMTGAGGLTFGGAASAAYTANYAATAAGGITFGGSAAASFDTGFSVTGSGGLVFGGAAAAQIGSANYLATGSGGLNLGGAAAVEFTTNEPLAQTILGGRRRAAVPYVDPFLDKVRAHWDEIEEAQAREAKRRETGTTSAPAARRAPAAAPEPATAAAAAGPLDLTNPLAPAPLLGLPDLIEATALQRERTRRAEEALLLMLIADVI